MNLTSPLPSHPISCVTLLEGLGKLGQKPVKIKAVLHCKRWEDRWPRHSSPHPFGFLFALQSEFLGEDGRFPFLEAELGCFVLGRGTASPSCLRIRSS